MVAIAVGAFCAPAARAQSAARPGTPAAGERALGSDEELRAWVQSLEGGRTERAAQVRAAAEQNRGSVDDALGATGQYRVAVVSPSGNIRAYVTYSRPNRTQPMEARAELLSPAGQPLRSFAVAPYAEFLVADDASWLVAIGNDLGWVATDGDLHLRLVFYDANGAEVGRDEGGDLSPLRSVVALPEAGLLVIGLPGRVIAWRFQDGTRAWTVATRPDWISNVVALPARPGDGGRVGVIATRAGAARLLVADALGRVAFDRPLVGRVEGTGWVGASDDGSLLAVREFVPGAAADGGVLLRTAIIDSENGEVLREVR